MELNQLPHNSDIHFLLRADQLCKVKGVNAFSAIVRKARELKESTLAHGLGH